MSAMYDEVRYRAAAVAVHESAQGVKEVGEQNRGPRIDVYKLRAHSPLSNNDDWCGFFVYYCLSEAGMYCNVPLPFIPEKLWSGYKLTKWAEAHPDTIVRSGPYLPGDVTVMKSGHIGIVAGQASSDILETVDGNQRKVGTGYSLRRRTRNVADTRLVIRI